MRIPLFSRLLPILICSLTLIFAVSGQCLGDQRFYLLEFKNSLNFNSTLSTKLVRWNQSVDCCSWEGVTCSEGRVVGLYLDNESIYGGLDNSSSLFRLHYLQHLSLAHNDFSPSCIPLEFGNLTNLSYLNLSYAGFAGQIPIEISRLTRLVTLDLSFTAFNNYFYYELKLENPNLATLVQNLTRLAELYLDEVIISSQGNEWCQALSSSLPNLRVLSMSRCNLSGPLDSSLQKLQSLSIINLEYNNFSAPVPEFFADFRNLTSLYLCSCGLNGQFPKKIFQVPTLQTVDLSDNELLHGSLPEFYPNGSLQSLLLSGSNFSGTLPDSIGDLKRLSEIDLSKCNFTGSIPNSMANLTQLVHLYMSSNYFTGPIPSFSMAKNLTSVVLSNNHLTGQIIFTHWRELQSLVGLYLYRNSLEGSIPASLFSLPSLRTLDLSNNHFSGQLNEFSNVSSLPLELLDLRSNYLEGPIPMSIFELQGLQTLSLSSNNLDLSYNSLLAEYSGTNTSLSSFPQIITLDLASNKLKTFPKFLRNQANLEHLDLSDNQIHGEIPNWFWKLPSLDYVNFSCNYLEGPLHNLSSISWLDLHSNQLQGQLPNPLPFFVYLDLSMNNFNSVIPALDWSLDGDPAPFILYLSSNKFHGQIPESICNVTFLVILDLSDNSLNGTIPQCLFSTSPALRVLNLKRNNLTGKISDTFSSYCSLQTLNVNKNLLEGVVPKSLANCTGLEVLDIGNNQINDIFPCYLKSISNLRVLVLKSNKFYGSIGCGGPNVTWPMLQIVDLASNNFSGRLSIKTFANSKAMMVDIEAQSELNYIHFEDRYMLYGYYQDVITITIKGQVIEMVKILKIFTSIDLSCNNLEGPIPEEIGVLKSLLILNLSHNSFTGQIPPSLGKLSQLESLDLSSNKLIGEIPVQLADGLIFLEVLNLSFNQLVGRIPEIKQFATFSETSYEVNKGLCGFPLKTTCTSAKPSSPPPTFADSDSNSQPLIAWNYINVELGFFFGFGMVIWPLVFCKRWRIRYCKHVDDILFRIFPQLYLGGKQYRGIRAHRIVGRRQ